MQKTRRGPAPPGGGQALTTAVAHHQTGRLAEAEAGYRAVLRTQPNHPDALHLLGVLAIQSGKPAVAVDLIRKAIARNGRAAAYHDNLGSALAAGGNHKDAANAHAQALRLQPDFAQARFNLGNALQAMGSSGRAAAALAGALALRPDYGKAWYNHGNALRALGRTEAAVAAYRHATALLPDLAEAHNNLGDALAALGRLDDAVAEHRTVIRLRPDDANAFYNLGAVLQQRGAFEEAEIAYREAVRRSPGHVGALNNLGSVLKRLGLPAQAELCHREALRLRPDFVEALYNLGNALHRQGRFDEAMACYEQVLERKPDLATASHNLALLSLLHGDLARGWYGYERRFAAGEAIPDRQPPLPRWQGEPLAGRRLLVWREQGVGDEMMFASSYGELLRVADGPVTIETDRRLVSLFARSFPAATVRAETLDETGRETVEPPDAALHVPAGSLPGMVRPALASFPPAAPWLVPDPERLAVWKARVAALGPGLTVGICWRSQLITEERRASYTTLDQWLPVLSVPGIRFVTLQYGDVEAEIRAVEERTGVALHRWGDLDLKDDFENVAALVGNLDLVVTVATSVGELAGALGVPVWRFGGTGDWSVLGTGCRPWYPSMRLFHAAAGEDLDGVLGRIAVALRRITPALPAAARPPAPRPADPKVTDPKVTDPKAADAWINRGVQAHRAGRIAEAETAYRAALDAVPDHPDALHLLGLTAHQTGQHSDALGLIRRSLAQDPDFPQARNNLGLVLDALGRHAEAGRQFAAAITLRPDFPEALSHLGLTEQKARRFDMAERWHRRAVRLQPANGRFRTNLGAAIEMSGRFAEAETAYRRSAVLLPDLPDGVNNLGTMARALGRFDDAKRWLRRALRLDPAFALAAWNLGLLRLADGDMVEGWAGYERRFSAPQLQRGRTLPIPVWRGEPLAGRRLLVWNEQGVGDEILFASCIGDLRSLDGTVVVECDRRLVPLFARAFPWAEVRAEVRAEAPECADCALQIAAGSLPPLVRPRLSGFPHRSGFLTPEPSLAVLWRERVAALGPGLKVGIAWKSQVVDAHRAAAYTTLEAFAPVGRTPGVVAVNLQYGASEADMAAAERALGARIHRWPDLDLKDDFESVAALTAALDLAIVPATAAGELAGALGVPVWRLGGSDWTWLGARVRPWYPSMRLWAPSPGETMMDVVGRTARELRHQLDRAAG
ncbi:tetratricopeptide repeat protein [Azospirillum sp. RWY-5-1]|uniref:Tetratricopeptide repeat protein n=1 Tax=Azospirillum oleiclasticum TaxID=2735135 RepID=A0ABX2TFD9_9PROT|nr:tetratricopeptide repeat protein [Azospirillum oleiclasticum]NYZ15442.1 tetratricopeptide repeat protein [Azospirillum oleiclasticum]NYZ22465.1 tetratricopeptide repeat protein [Azospirillum oleiclasticum]